MPDKERLEEMEKQIDWMTLKPSQINAISQIIDYAEEQAERVQEVEEHLRMTNQYVKKEREINFRLLEQNKRYREALLVISANLPLDGRDHYVSIARKALEEYNNGIN